MHFTGTSQVISFNPHYLLDGLTAAALCGQAPGDEAGQQIPGAGRIRLDFTSPAKPALITWIDGEATADGDEARPVAEAPDSGGNGGARHDAVADSASGHEPTTGPAAEATAFRYLVVPLRAPAAG
jgi:DNA polymerase III sliding clamp (beta) subunit (PCNA family)